MADTRHNLDVDGTGYGTDDPAGEDYILGVLDDSDLDAPVHDLAYGCDSPECVICDGTEEAWS